MSILGDIVNIRGALQQQKLASALDPLQIQQAQLQMQMMQNPAMWQALGNVNGLLGGQQPDQSQQPPQPPAQPTTGGLLQHLATGATGAINAAQPGGGLLSMPPQQGGLLGGQTTQSPTGPVSTFGLGNAPSAGQPPAQAPQPSQQQGPDPFEIIRQAQPLLGSPFPALKARGEGAVAYANSLLQNDPRYVQRKAAAGSVLSQDQYAVQQAQQGADPMAIKAAQMKYLNDSGLVKVANNNGAVTTFGGLTPGGLGMSGVNPENGYQYSNGQMTAIPGAPQARAAVAGAVAGAESANKYVPVYDGKGNQVGNLAAGSQLPAGYSFGLSPGSAKLSGGQGEEANETLKEYQDQAENGKDLIAQVQQLRSAAANLGPGKFSGVQGEYLNLLNSAGWISDADKTKLGSYQEGQKISIQLQAAVTKQLGSREAAQVFGTMGRSIPNLTMSPDGLDKVTGYLSGIARYNMARADAAQNLGNQNDVAGVNNVRDSWIQKSNPSYYIFASLSPSARAEELKQMGAGGAKSFLQKWNAAANAGMAPRPNDYAGQ